MAASVRGDACPWVSRLRALGVAPRQGAWPLVSWTRSCSRAPLRSRVHASGLVGLTFVAKGPLAWREPYFDSRPHFALGIALGAINAYLLGVWDSVGEQGAIELWASSWWIFLGVAAIAAFFTLRRSRRPEQRGSGTP